MTEREFKMFLDIFQIWCKDNSVKASQTAWNDLKSRLTKFYDFVVVKQQDREADRLLS